MTAASKIPSRVTSVMKWLYSSVHGAELGIKIYAAELVL